MEALLLSTLLMLMVFSHAVTGNSVSKGPTITVSILTAILITAINYTYVYPKVKELVELKAEYNLEMTKYELDLLLKIRKDQLTLETSDYSNKD